MIASNVSMNIKVQFGDIALSWNSFVRCWLFRAWKFLAFHSGRVHRRASLAQPALEFSERSRARCVSSSFFQNAREESIAVTGS